MNQADLRSLAEERILDADILIKGARYSFAYYAAGYAAECALKSCMLARMIHTGWVFQEKSKIQDCLTHDFGELVNLSGLTEPLNFQLKTHPDFVKNWGITKQWKVTARYSEKTELEAKELYAAITDDQHGVFQWIKTYW